MESMLVSKIKAVLAMLLVIGLFAGLDIGLDVSTNSVVVAQGKLASAGPDGARKRLKDPDPQIRLKAALDLSGQLDEEAITVLIELLAVLPAAQRRQAEVALQGVAEEWSPNPALAGDDEISRRILHDAWAGWWRTTDGPALLAAFRKRTLSPDQLAQALSRIAELGDEMFATRQRAAAELVALGLPVVPLLRQAAPATSLEQSRRLEQCLQQIAQAHNSEALPAVAARLLALRKPAGAIETLLAYVPFTEDEVMKAEVAKALHRLAAAGVRPDGSVRKLLADPDTTVRLRLAVALTCAGDRETLPASFLQRRDPIGKLSAQRFQLVAAVFDHLGDGRVHFGGNFFKRGDGALGLLDPLADLGVLFVDVALERLEVFLGDFIGHRVVPFSWCASL
jgi:hypothetical protein